MIRRANDLFSLIRDPGCDPQRIREFVIRPSTGSIFRALEAQSSYISEPLSKIFMEWKLQDYDEYSPVFQYREDWVGTASEIWTALEEEGVPFLEGPQNEKSHLLSDQTLPGWIHALGPILCDVHTEAKELQCLQDLEEEIVSPFETETDACYHRFMIHYEALHQITKIIKKHSRVFVHTSLWDDLAAKIWRFGPDPILLTEDEGTVVLTQWHNIHISDIIFR